MKIKDIKIKESDRQKLNLLVGAYEDVFVLGHEEHLTDIGELSDYFKSEYGDNIFQQIICSEEVTSKITYGILKS